MQLDTARIGLAPPPWRKWRAFFGRSRLTTATFTDVMADVYEDRTAFLLDKPLESSFFSGHVVSYRDLQRLTARAAGMLHDLGVRRGDRVALCTLNRIELVFVELGALRIGAIPVPLNFMLTASEIEQLVAQSGARVMVTDRTVFEQNIGDPARVPSIETWVLVTQRAVPPGAQSFAALMEAASESTPPADVADDEPAIIFFTAGTTGLPKGAVLTAGGLMYGFRTYAKLAAVLPTPSRRLALQVMPLAHTGGHQALLTLMALATPTIVMGRFDPALVLDAIERHRVSVFAGIPAMYRMLLDAGAERRDLSSVRVWGGGGDAFPRDLIERFRALAERRLGPLRLRPLFVIGYGMAETSGQVSLTPPYAAGDSCIGWFLPGVRFRVVDAEGHDVDDGEPGELLLRSPGMMRGYWNDPAASDAALRDGWLRTGDVVRVGSWGIKYFVAREKEMIKVGGYSVFPAEIEHVLDRHPAVRSSVVVGVAHPIKGEIPIAAVVLRPGETISKEELLAWARERIAPYRCPRGVEFLPSIPHGFAMKPLRRLVRERLAEMGASS
ncbi:MAG TPA: AMP-binding protein [Polyangiaceae bacterium]|nr:AMP-binding protein [Polyangiaceae bacterium]